MRIERYYASLREEVSPINTVATTLLTRQDYVGFFKACGPTYVRGIRRAQEATAVLEFESNSEETTKQYVSNVQVQSSSGWSKSKYQQGFESSRKFQAISKSLRITILGYGLGLSEEGSETLVATTLEEFKNAMKFAYISMTKGRNSVHIGQVYGIEVVPWVENAQFQVVSGVQEESIEIPIARSVIAKAHRKTNVADFNFVNTEREEFKCKNSAYSMDMYGYCCEPVHLYDAMSAEYNSVDPQLKVCRPLRLLDKATITDNMIANAEFVARLDKALRYKNLQLNTMEKCLSAVRSIPARFDYFVLKKKDSTKSQYVYGDATIELTPFEMKMALDPFNDYRFIKHMAQELDEFLEMFYSPCMAALFGANIGTSSDTESSYFMAYPWYNHEECMQLSCFGTSVRWDRNSGGGGGCVPSLIRGANATGYDDGDDLNCAMDVDEGDDANEVCKYDTEELSKVHSDLTTCWSNVLPVGRVDYFMSQYCMPEISGKKIDDSRVAELENAYANYCLVNPNDT